MGTDHVVVEILTPEMHREVLNTRVEMGYSQE